MGEFKLLEKDERVNYYLGNILSKITVPINLDIYIPNKIYNSIDDLGNKINYDIPLKKRLTDINKTERRFLYHLGDIQHNIQSPDLVKNRELNGDNNSVLLRCLNFDRHWYNYYNKPNDLNFEDKQGKLYWRGMTTGQEDRPGNRFNLVNRWFDKNEKIDIGFSSICQGKDAYKMYVKEESPIEEFLKYKYILSVEGNDRDSGLNWKLNSNSVILMAKPTKESWLMEGQLVENYHYILLDDDYSNLLEKINWCEENQSMCKSVIENASKYMRQFEENDKEKEIENEVLSLYFERTM